jgi:D-alanyl-D-alanine carboxypeptidase/D-alanyl-D-alanine-endopeptidase (penicillin-binding protein 4)
MKKLLTPFFLMFAFNVFAESAFESQLTPLIQQYIPRAHFGMIIQEISTGNIIFEQHAIDNFYPASNTKLFTAAAGLKFFGPNFQYQTSIHSHPAKIKSGILEDNLYFIFRGDPSLTVNDVNLMIKQLNDKGIKQIKGNIIIDDKSFDEIPYAPGWTQDSIAWYYSAPVSTIILNENKVRLKFNKTDQLNQYIKIEQADEAIPPLKIQTAVLAVTPEAAEKNCALNAKVKNNEITLTGCWPIDKTPINVELAIDDPRLLAKLTLLQALKLSNIAFTGVVLFEKAPNDLSVLLVKRSPELKNLLFKILADSNNLYTESLTKALGLAYLGKGSFQQGTQAITAILSPEGQFDFSQTRFSDGSGQSRYNLVSPLLISKLLGAMQKDPHFSDFYSALSISGMNGTLATRMKNNDLEGKIIAKTGSASGTSALSGYFTGKSGNTYLFSMIINQSTNDNGSKVFEDKLCQLMVEEPWRAKAAPSP